MNSGGLSASHNTFPHVSPSPFWLGVKNWPSSHKRHFLQCTRYHNPNRVLIRLHQSPAIQLSDSNNRIDPILRADSTPLWGSVQTPESFKTRLMISEMTSASSGDAGSLAATSRPVSFVVAAVSPGPGSGRALQQCLVEYS
jgi:hypothetical protein